MKLSKLYSNKPQLFEPINFIPGLNVVLAEIRLPETKEKDTHNLGKTTLGRLLDFNLLSTKDNKFFLFKHYDRFKDFIFFLEIELLDKSFITIRRSVSEATKISFKHHQNSHQDFNLLSDTQWDHSDIPFERAKQLLDGLLDLRGLAPWHYRKGLGYLLRTQDDFRDVFQLRKFAGAHSDWKPFLAHILGFNANIIKDYYKIEESLEKKRNEEIIIKSELGGSLADISKVEGMLLLKQKELEKKQFFLNSFDFRNQDKDQTKKIVDIYDDKIALLNEERYSLSQNRKKIVSALNSEQVLFDPNSAAQVFKEAGVFFGGQLKKDFEQLISFNKAITEERIQYLTEEKNEIEVRLRIINSELSDLGKKRADALSFLSSTDIFDKYKKISDEVITLKADIVFHIRQKEFLHNLQSLRTEIRTLSDQKLQLQTAIEKDVEMCNADTSSLFSSLRLFFNEIIEEVIDRKALLSVSINSEGHLDFNAEILDDSGNTTSASLGHTYKKLLCFAFDMALLRAHFQDKFPKFIFHDGVFESLDDRKKLNLLDVIHKYTSIGIQSIITLIDSDLPKQSDNKNSIFSPDDIVLLLHDENDKGRLFKMQSW
jgi:uncharacterized protein YydD (DUF2326 family)